MEFPGIDIQHRRNPNRERRNPVVESLGEWIASAAVAVVFIQGMLLIAIKWDKLEVGSVQQGWSIKSRLFFALGAGIITFAVGIYRLEPQRKKMVTARWAAAMFGIGFANLLAYKSLIGTKKSWKCEAEGQPDGTADNGAEPSNSNCKGLSLCANASLALSIFCLLSAFLVFWFRGAQRTRARPIQLRGHPADGLVFPANVQHVFVIQRTQRVTMTTQGPAPPRGPTPAQPGAPEGEN